MVRPCGRRTSGTRSSACSVWESPLLPEPPCRRSSVRRGARRTVVRPLSRRDHQRSELTDIPFICPRPNFLTSLVSVVPVPSTRRKKKSKRRRSPQPAHMQSRATPRRQLTLVRNSHFRSWSPDAPGRTVPDEIVWRILSRPKRRAARQGGAAGEAVREVIDGKADVLFNEVPNNRVEELLAHTTPAGFIPIPQRATVFLFLNTRRAPFDDVRVRRALNYAIDRQKVADLHGGSAVATPTCRSCLLPCRDIVASALHDRTGQQRRLEGARPSESTRTHSRFWHKGRTDHRLDEYPNFGKGEQLPRLAPPEARLSLAAQKVCRSRDLRHHTRRTPNVQAGILGWFGFLSQRRSSQSFPAAMSRTGPTSATHASTPKSNHLAAEQARDPTAGKALAEKIDRELDAKAPWVPLFTPRLADFVSSRVGNYQPTPTPQAQSCSISFGFADSFDCFLETDAPNTGERR